MQAMIRADGGKGDFEELVPPMLGIWNTLVNGSSDATWVRGSPAHTHMSVKHQGLNSVQPLH